MAVGMCECVCDKEKHGDENEFVLETTRKQLTGKSIIITPPFYMQGNNIISEIKKKM